MPKVHTLLSEESMVSLRQQIFRKIATRYDTDTAEDLASTEFIRILNWDTRAGTEEECIKVLNSQLENMVFRTMVAHEKYSSYRKGLNVCVSSTDSDGEALDTTTDFIEEIAATTLSPERIVLDRHSFALALNSLSTQHRRIFDALASGKGTIETAEEVGMGRGSIWRIQTSMAEVFDKAMA